ncbi:YugN-like family protein [Lederbergia panacisoli]|uniref:YugN-like family protein n=1 Tax=Lederbergia panacisoli TaxID=1255251 RepID=UPI00214C94E8|nr:YugN-like family protein [Lederbergia panacisoli]MCR2823157.1 YugN-like family protein [Lederbergia panacisoli]
MFEINSTIEGRQYNLHKLEQLMKPKGYVIGGNWDYDRGFFDYKMANDDGYQFLRIPFTAVEGQLDTPGVSVQLGTPFVLSHVYQKGLDDHADSSNMSAAFNQFSEPEDPDGDLDEKYIQMGKDLIKELESLLSF